MEKNKINIFGDLHIHTVYSDGAYTVDEILKYVSGKVDFIAITDHDDVIGAIEANKQCKNYQVKSILGVEISTTYHNESIHVLGYFNSLEAIRNIQGTLDNIRQNRITRLLKMKDLLKEHFNIDLDTSALLKHHSVTRGSIATQILSQGYPYTREELFAKVIGDDCKAYVPVSKITPIDAIKLIKENNGLAILAHPVQIKKTPFEEIIKMGFDGLEGIYPVNTKVQTRNFCRYADKNNLLVTGGSDFHDFNTSDHGNLLSIFIKNERLNKFIEAINELS